MCLGNVLHITTCMFGNTIQHYKLFERKEIVSIEHNERDLKIFLGLEVVFEKLD